MERKKILVVEDEQTTRRMLSFNLKQQGYDVFEAEDGTNGLRMVSEERPNLILLDIMMPGENGFEVIKRIRANPEISDTPIIVLTARAGLADKQFAFKAGADEYLTKPINLQDLNARVEEFLASVEKQKKKEPALAPGQIVGVFSPQRKMGATTLAIRLSEAVSKQKKHPVVLVDLSLPRGDVAPLLGLNATENVARLLSRPTVQITPETVVRYMQTTRRGFRVIPAPHSSLSSARPIPDNLAHFLQLMVEASYIAILDLGTALTELSLAALRQCNKIFALTSGQAPANEALDNFLILARKLGLDLARLLPVVNQLYGPASNNIVLVRSPIARVPYIPPQSTESMWTNELALQKLSTIITST
jgi:CheY-like chemotaxis protein/MinD-like ATPase involved in chromosome partitioning or flagellar assembly